MTGYTLSCPVCGESREDTYLLSCPNGCNSLLRTEYSTRQITLRDAPGIFRYKDWLPVGGFLSTRSAPVCYKSSGLAAELGLSDLWIGFSGYWPERGAYVTSGSFKEFEALPTIVRLRERAGGVIQVSSAGNTGRAFAQVSAESGQPVLVVVPQGAAGRLWTTIPCPNVLLVTVDGDYTDAITLGNRISEIPGVYPEGGAKNVARRDGMGTVMLAGTLAIGHMPSWYVQAVGSGTGGIAAYEASLRLIGDGRFGDGMPRLCLIQNDPFIPMVRAWNAGRRTISEEDMPDAKGSIARVYSDLLTNRTPPYGIAGGVFDALTATRGVLEQASTREAEEAGRLFLSSEGVDPDPAAAVAVAGLIRSLEKGVIRTDETVLLAITGGGYQRGMQDFARIVKEPDIRVDAGTDMNQVLEKIQEWVKQHA